MFPVSGVLRLGPNPTAAHSRTNYRAESVSTVTHGQKIQIVVWAMPPPAYGDSLRHLIRAQGPLEFVGRNQYSSPRILRFVHAATGREK
jgi:hypothetical protein